jgi:hypothetical protein
MEGSGSTKAMQQNLEGIGMLDQQFSKVQYLGWKVITFLSYPWIDRNSSFFSFLFYFFDFVLKCRFSFPMLVLENCPLRCDL